MRRLVQDAGFKILAGIIIAFVLILILCVIPGLFTTVNFELIHFSGLIWKLCGSQCTACTLFFSSNRVIFQTVKHICEFIFLQKKRMSVSTGIVAQEDPAEKKWQERQEYKLREKMIKKKHRNLYRSMMKGKAERAKEAWLLAKKRRLHDEQENAKLKAEKKEKRLNAIVA